MQGKIEGFRFDEALFEMRLSCRVSAVYFRYWRSIRERGETKRAQVNTSATYTLVFGNTSSRLYKGDIIEWRSALCGK